VSLTAARKFVLQLRIGKSSTNEIHKLSIMAKGKQPARSANFLSFSKVVLCKSGFQTLQLPGKQHKIKIPELSNQTLVCVCLAHDYATGNPG